MEKALKTAPNGVVIKVAWLHYNDRRQVLFARSRGQTAAYSVGGKPEAGETLEQDLIREANEETGAELIPETIKLYAYFEGPCHGYVEGTKLQMHCFTADYRGELKAQEGDNVEELVYLGVSDIKTGRTTDMGDQILDHLAYHGLVG